MGIGKKLKRLLKREKISAYKLGQEVKIDQGYLSKIINGKTQPTFAWMERVLKYLGYSIEFKKKGVKRNE